MNLPPIICFAHDWDSDPTSKTHIMRILARRGHRVLWVNSIGVRRPTMSGRDLRRITAKLRKIIGGCVEVEPNLLVANPPALPFPGVTLAEHFNATLISASLRRLCRKHGLERPIVWTFLPNMARLIGRLNERVLVYHVVDEYAQLPGMSVEATRQLDREVSTQADLILTSSRQLCEERKVLNPNTHFISHGVDILHFGKALHPATEVPEELASIPRPIVGFFGLLADWVDIDVIREIAVARPDWSLVLVGKSITDLSALADLPNVHLLGQKPYSTLPGYCRGFDVGIIPFRVNALTIRANPLKMREYLASGLPVIATPLPEIERYSETVTLAKNAHEFVAGIAAAIKERSSENDRRRVQAMQNEDWESKVDQIESILQHHLADK